MHCSPSGAGGLQGLQGQGAASRSGLNLNLWTDESRQRSFTRPRCGGEREMESAEGLLSVSSSSSSSFLCLSPVFKLPLWPGDSVTVGRDKRKGKEMCAF